MAEAAACVFQGFYEPPDATSVEEEVIPEPRLDSSISFGRYVSESLDWGKWSSFRQNRFLEDAEKYSRPGLVAQKKAYFEAYYKRKVPQKVAGLPGQANAATFRSTAEEAGDGGNCEHGGVVEAYAKSQLAESQVGVAAATELQEVKEPNADASILVCPSNNSCFNEHDSVEQKILQIDQVGGDQTIVVLPMMNSCSSQHDLVEPRIEQDDREAEDQNIMESEDQNIIASSIIFSSTSLNSSSPGEETHNPLKFEEKDSEVENQTPEENPSKVIPSETIADVENQNATVQGKPSKTSQLVKLPLQESSAANQEISASKEKKQRKLFSKWPIFGRTSMASSSSVKPVTPSHPRKENIANLSSKKSAYDINNKQISTPRLLHTSSLQRTCETMPLSKKTNCPNEKILDSKLVTKSAKTTSGTPHSGSPPATSSTRVSTTRLPKVASLAPESDAKMTRTPLQKADPCTRKRNVMCQSVSTECWKASRSSGKRPSQIICSPFSFRCEERAERRKEFFLKLEEKLNAEKLQRQAKDKEMAENELKRLRQGLGFRARPLPDFYRKTEPPKIEIKKIPPTRAQSPKLGRKVTLGSPVSDCFPCHLRPSAWKGDSLSATESDKKLGNTHIGS